jgi:O-antigen/teichoic acid export membrane protein
MKKNPEKTPLIHAQKTPRNDTYYSTDRIRRGLIYYLSGRGVTAIASVLVPILLVRTLSVADYAWYTAFSGLLITLMALSNFGIERVVPRYFPELRNAGAEKELQLTCRWLVLLRAVLLIAVLLPFLLNYDQFAEWFNLPRQTEIKWLFAAYALSFGMTMHITRSLQALMLQKEATVGIALEWFFKLGLLIIALAIQGGIDLGETLLLQGGTAAIGAMYMLWQLEKHLMYQKNKVYNQNILNRKQAAKTGFQNYLWVLSGMYTDPSLIKLTSSSFFSANITAALGFSYAITGVIQRYLPAVLLLNLIEPTVMAKYTENRNFKQITQYFSIILKFNLFILTPATTWFLFNGEPIVEILTKGKYPESLWLISGLMVILILQSHTLIMQLACNAVEKSELLFWGNIWALPLLVPSAVLIYFFKMPGVIVSVMGIIIFRNCFIAFRLRRLGYFYTPDWRGTAKIAIAAIIATMIANSISPIISVGLVKIVLTGLVTLLAYVGLTFIWKPFSEDERQTLNRFLGKRYFVW